MCVDFYNISKVTFIRTYVLVSVCGTYIYVFVPSCFIQYPASFNDKKSLQVSLPQDAPDSSTAALIVGSDNEVGFY